MVVVVVVVRGGVKGRGQLGGRVGEGWRGRKGMWLERIDFCWGFGLEVIESLLAWIAGSTNSSCGRRTSCRWVGRQSDRRQ